VGSWRGLRHDGSLSYESSSVIAMTLATIIGDMSDYTHLNLKDAEDQAPNFGLGDNLEFRMARVPLGLEHSGVSYLKVAPGFRFPFGHKHKNQEEVYVLVGGAARMKIGGRGQRPRAMGRGPRAQGHDAVDRSRRRGS